MSENETPLAHGRQVIKRYLDTLPNTPGVYRMLDQAGDALYIGKAKNLKNRVSNYVNVGALNTRLQRMVSQTMSMEITTTRSEAEALMLEANLIKKLSPRYNILLKDDKSFPYILFSGNHGFPRISKYRGAKTAKGKYFGPFVSAGAVNETLALLQKAFLLRPCADTVFKHRTRPCLQYQIKRCSAPCVGKINQEEYAELVAQAQDFLSGKSSNLQEALAKEMQTASLKMDYEKARVLRDRIRALNLVQQQQDISTAQMGNIDIVAMARDGDEVCVQMYSVRAGQNYGNRSYFPRHVKEHTDSEIIETFLAQRYQNQPPPHTILTNVVVDTVELLEEALRLNTDYKVEIAHPSRGEKRKLLEGAVRNAKEALARHIAVTATQSEILEKLQELFGLEDTPARIEVYDNSHISGSNSVGAMIVAGAEGFLKNEYRKFSIKSKLRSSPSALGAAQAAPLNVASPRDARPEEMEISPGDDYAMLREVLTRRFKRLQDEGDKAIIPDLVLIDGGAGQLSVAQEVFEELGIQDITYVAIAKGRDRNAGREWFHRVGHEPFQLPKEDKVLHYLQRLRDEAHRFAIGTHRDKRSKSMQTSTLDGIENIGPARKKALLQHFGSASGVASASVDDIAKVEGINTSLAEQIYAYFHG